MGLLVRELSDAVAFDDESVATPPNEATEAAAPPLTTHRLRDLDRRGRFVAAALALALLLAPVAAFAWAAPDWTPANDPALMALRVYDVGTNRTPMLGQPSTSDMYTSDHTDVFHPGPVHFYVMAPAVRLLGAAHGMLAVSLLITSSCVLVAAWAIYRRLGPAGGVLGAVVLGAITFTTGATTLVNPVSSNIARYPLLCSMVLVWCLLCGDLRLAPLAAAVLSFTGQQHLSVLPTVLVTTVLGAVGCLVAWGGEGRWRDPVERRRLARWGGLAGGAWVLVWSPVLFQQFFGRGPGNLSAMATFALQDDRSSVGWGSALQQAAHVLGLPPLLGQLSLDGRFLQVEPSVLTWVSALAVATTIGWLAVRWWRPRPHRARMAVMAGIVLTAGLVNGSSVPSSVERWRLSLYHWAWPLTLFVCVLLGLALVDLASRVEITQRQWVPTFASGAAVLAIVVPGVVNPHLDRPSNTLAEALSPFKRGVIDDVADQVAAHRDEIPETVVIINRGEADMLLGITQAVAVQLEQRGLPVREPQYLTRGIHVGRLARADELDGGLVLVIEHEGPGEPVVEPIEGRKIAEAHGAAFDDAAYDELAAALVGGDPVQLTPEGEQALNELPKRKGEVFALLLAQLPDMTPDDAVTMLTNKILLEYLRDHPPASPELDPETIDRVIDSLPVIGSLHLTVYLQTRAEMLATAGSAEITAPPLRFPDEDSPS